MCLGGDCRRCRRCRPSAQLCPLSLLQRLTARRAGLVVRAAQVSSNDFKTGMTIEMDGAPYKVVGASRAAVRNMFARAAPKGITFLSGAQKGDGNTMGVADCFKSCLDFPL